MDLEKVSPLDLAAHYDHGEIIDYLLEYNIGKMFIFSKVIMSDSNGFTNPRKVLFFVNLLNYCLNINISSVVEFQRWWVRRAAAGFSNPGGLAVMWWA